MAFGLELRPWVSSLLDLADFGPACMLGTERWCPANTRVLRPQPLKVMGLEVGSLGGDWVRRAERS